MTTARPFAREITSDAGALMRGVRSESSKSLRLVAPHTLPRRYNEAGV